MRRRVAGHGDDIESDSRDLDRLPSLEEHLGGVGAEHEAGRGEAIGILEK